MAWNRGYALLETLIATLILAIGLVSLASIFSFSIAVNLRNQQRTTATLLLYDKLEQLQSAPATDGGSLDAAHSVTGFAEYITIAADGSVLIDNSNLQAPFLRLWQVQSTTPASVSVAILARAGGAVPLELARGTRYIEGN